MWVISDRSIVTEAYPRPPGAICVLERKPLVPSARLAGKMTTTKFVASLLLLLGWADGGFAMKGGVWYKLWKFMMGPV